MTLVAVTAPQAIDVLAVSWFALLTIGYAVLCGASVVAGRRELRDEGRRALGAARLAGSLSQPRVTIVVPAHDEAAAIVLGVRALLTQQWHQLEVIVVCNGCTDGTLDELQRAFALEQTPDSLARSPGAVAHIRSAWASRADARLRVFDTGAGGKADALNCGLERATGSVFCTVDADSLLVPDAIARVVLPFVEQGSDVVAVGSVVRVLNGSQLEGGRVARPGLPRTLRGRMQVVEYARGFQIGRAGWAELGALPIISGAFSAFRTSALRTIGGFRVDTVGEDMEVVLRLHDHFRPRAGARSVVFVPRPLCYTEVPEDAADLRAQRIRWQHGLVESTLAHRRQMFDASTRAGRSSLPFLAVFELLAPVVEVIGVLGVLLAAVLGLLAPLVAAALLALAISVGVLLGAVGVLMEQSVGGRLVGAAPDAARLLVAAVAEQLGPRQQVAWWRLRALATARRRRPATWAAMHHRGAGRVASMVDDTSG
ncbi:MAG: glycosyltransferase [Thermoleophilia bacterium]|nr:glycosyltransferase [Thermoleophilia bacterium]